MGHTLEQLLDATGVSDLQPGMSKTASEKKGDDSAYFLKLAERCHKAATETPAPSNKELELAEKTASVAVISRTLEEISGILGEPAEKQASDQKLELFIKTAVDAGHTPEEIAVFLKEAGIWDWLFRKYQNMRGSAHLAVGAPMKHLATSKMGKATTALQASLRNAAENLGPNDLNRHIAGLRATVGNDKDVAKLIKDSGIHMGSIRNLKEIQGLTKLHPEIFAEAPLASATVGGKTLGVTMDQAKKYGIPAAVGAGGLALGRASASGGGNEGGSRTVIVPR